MSGPWSRYSIRQDPELFTSASTSTDPSTFQEYSSSSTDDTPNSSKSRTKQVIAAGDCHVFPAYTGRPITPPTTHASSPSLFDHDLDIWERDIEGAVDFRCGNPLQHVRQKHAPGLGITLPCEAAGCDRFYLRKDAKLEHLFKRHPELSRPPVHQRQSAMWNALTPHRHPARLNWDDLDLTHTIEHVGAWITSEPKSTQNERTQSQSLFANSCSQSFADNQDSVFTYGDLSGTTFTDDSSIPASFHLQRIGCNGFVDSEDFDPCSYSYMVEMDDLDDRAELLEVSGMMRSQSQPLVNNGQNFRRILMTHRPVLPCMGQYLIDSMKAMLEPELHLRYWVSFFNLWEGILKVLETRRTESHQLFAPVLEIIRQSVQLHTDDTYCLAHSEGQRLHTDSKAQVETNPTKKRKSAIETLPIDQKRFRDLDTAEDLGEEVQIKLCGDSRGNASARVDCIIHKHHLMHNTVPRYPCGGYSAVGMSQLRHQHLQPSRTKAHGGLMDFLERCGRCKEYVVDSELWQRHKANECHSKTQSRHDTLEARWARLYLAKYPDEILIPSPFVHEKAWLDIEKSEQYRQAYFATLAPTETTSGSFMGNQHLPPSASVPASVGVDAINHEPPPVVLPEMALRDSAYGEFGTNAAFEVMLTHAVNPHSLMEESLHLSPSFNFTSSPIPSYEEILDRSLQHLSGLLDEGIGLHSHADRNHLADQVETRLLSLTARLREWPSTIPTTAETNSKTLPDGTYTLASSLSRFDIMDCTRFGI